MIYVDTCLIIYAVENEGSLGSRARALLASEDISFAISPLVVLEVLAGALRTGSEAVITEYQRLFARLALIEPDLDDYVYAAELRAANPGLKTIDALHLAAAQLGGCTALWTNDKRFTTAAGSFAVDVIGG